MRCRRRDGTMARGTQYRDMGSHAKSGGQVALVGSLHGLIVDCGHCTVPHCIEPMVEVEEALPGEAGAPRLALVSSFSARKGERGS
jgi:hypothetical protein